MCALRVNETKLTSGNAFIVDLFPLGGEKESKYDERTHGVLTCLLTLSLRKTQSVFVDYFSFSHFLGTSCYF